MDMIGNGSLTVKQKDNMEAQNILVIAPHPDDEVLGCGGTIRKYASKGHHVYVLVVTRGNQALYSEEQILNIRKEASSAHAILGVEETHYLDFSAPDLDITSGAKIARSLASYIYEKAIHILFLPHHGDIHHDHRAVFNAGLVAARPLVSCPVRSIYSYETLSETEWSPPEPSLAFVPTMFVDISEQMKDKLAAMSAYNSQIQKFPSTRSLETIEALATFRGSTAGYARAEAFKVVRQRMNEV
jgi:LmbE family N-acetylglucosaminyl deacetylase